MPEIHKIELPREVVMGEGVIKLSGDIMKRMNLKSALLVTGERTYEVAGEDVIDSLKEAGSLIEHLIVKTPTMEEVEKVRGRIREIGPDVVVGVGGGKIIDVAKLSSAKQRIPFISVPTNASHDGTTSPFASIKGGERPYSIRAQAPIAVIADTTVIARSPYRFIASGCGDIIAKYTAVRDWLLAHLLKKEDYSEYAADLALMSSKLIMKNARSIRKNTEASIRILVKALISCGVAISIAASTRPCSGSEHLFSHALDFTSKDHALHGEQCGVGTIMMAYLHGLNWKKVKQKLQIIGAPTTADELHIRPKYIVKALTYAHKIRPERYTILEDKALTEDSAKNLARETGVIS